jgi:hypothetical protein
VRGSALRLVLVVFGALVALWLLGALVQGLLVSLSLTASRFFLFYWWFQKFGLGVIVGFVLGLAVGWLLAQRGNGDRPAHESRSPTDDHLAEARRQLRALEEELGAERKELS